MGQINDKVEYQFKENVEENAKNEMIQLMEEVARKGTQFWNQIDISGRSDEAKEQMYHHIQRHLHQGQLIPKFVYRPKHCSAYAHT
jgi:hypothetical protein